MIEKHTYEEAFQINASIGLVKNSELSIESFTKLYKLKKNIKAKIDELTEMQKELMGKYGVEETNGSFSFNDHPEKAAINKDFFELIKTEITIEPRNFMTMAEIQKATKDQNMNEITLLIDTLVQE